MPAALAGKLPDPSTTAGSLCVFWDVVSASVLFTSTLVTEGTVRSSRISRIGRVVDGRRARPRRRGEWEGFTAGTPASVRRSGEWEQHCNLTGVGRPSEANS